MTITTNLQFEENNLSTSWLREVMEIFGWKYFLHMPPLVIRAKKIIIGTPR
jgi:hypothetical protein